MRGWGNVIPHFGAEPARRLVSLSGMKFKLKALHHNGIVLTSEELADAPRYVGNLIVEEWPQVGASGRYLRQVRLLDMTIPGTPRDLIPPLFEPQIVKMTENQMTLHGYQINVDAETGAIRHYAQSWVLRAITDDLGSMRR
jgi:hypothetical protein